jgi:hypothetical protein
VAEHVLVDRRLRHHDAELTQFPEYPWCSPSGIGS